MSEFRKKPERSRPGTQAARPADRNNKPAVAPKIEVTRGHEAAGDSLFEQLLQKVAGAEAALRHGRRMLAEPFASLEYSRELEIKNKAFAALCAQSGLPVPESVIAAPQPRHYRTTTKRRMVWSKARPDLIVEGNPFNPMSSALEPETHTALFTAACDLLTAKPNRKLAGDLNYVIIREDRRGLLLLFNIARIDAAIVRQYRALSTQLAREHKLAGVSLYHDPTRSEYYLEAHTEDGAPQLKHLSGIKTLQQNIGGLDYECALTGFSQVNHPVAAIMRDMAVTLLEPQPGSHLADLYCGNGFFSKALAAKYSSLCGIDYDRATLNFASKNLAGCGTKFRFFAARIDAQNVTDSVSVKTLTDVVLDPPRKGTGRGVIESLAAMNVRRVLHVFCGVDTLADELNRWKKSGYMPRRIVPLDMFAGCAALEVMVLLERRG